MRSGRASQTAVLVCMGRALAHGTTPVARFSDPTALALLPDEARARVERLRAGGRPKGLRSALERVYFEVQGRMMVARTVAIDDAIREAAAPQVVLLGAGLDGRAWRMPELRDVAVFEVDHPDTQRDKRARASALPEVARDVRFVPVDFEREGLDDALAAAGQDPDRPTTWVWEGVVMYLTPAQVEATLAVVARRSAPGSRVIVAYHAPAPALRIVNLFVRCVGEPLRSAYTADGMRRLLAVHGFAVGVDDDLAAIARAVSPELARATRSLKHARIAVADRNGKGRGRGA